MQFYLFFMSLILTKVVDRACSRIPRGKAKWDVRAERAQNSDRIEQLFNL